MACRQPSVGAPGPEGHRTWVRRCACEPLARALTNARAAGAGRPLAAKQTKCGVFRPTQDGESENPVALPDITLALIGEGPFSLVRFFLLAPLALALRAGFAVRMRCAHAVGQQKEMNPVAIANGSFCSSHSSRSYSYKTKGFPSPAASESLFFAGPKKRNQKKGPSPTELTGHSWTRRDFSTGHPCPVEKRLASMPAALRVFVHTRS
jgi:hypothetical protein